MGLVAGCWRHQVGESCFTTKIIIHYIRYLIILLWAVEEKVASCIRNLEPIIIYLWYGLVI